MLPFYSSVLTPKEQEGIEENNLEELTEELAKVKAGGWWGIGQHLLVGLTAHLLPTTPLPGDSGLHRNGEFLEKVQQSETGATEPPTQTSPAARY